jgi:hypothetical protein
MTMVTNLHDLGDVVVGVPAAAGRDQSGVLLVGVVCYFVEGGDGVPPMTCWWSSSVSG